MSRSRTLLAALMLVAFGAPALADTTNVKTQSVVEIKKAGAHCADDPACFNRYHPNIKPVATAKPGQLIVVHTRDAFDSKLNVNSLPKDVTALDLNLVHPMTGPIHIEGAKRGDVLAVKLIDIAPDEYGYTVMVPGFGFLRDRFTEAAITNWKLNRLEAVSDQMPAVRIPMRGFMGSVGVLPGEPEVKAWLAREAALGAAGGVALPPEPTGARPADRDPRANARTGAPPDHRKRMHGGLRPVEQPWKGRASGSMGWHHTAPRTLLRCFVCHGRRQPRCTLRGATCAAGGGSSSDGLVAEVNGWTDEADAEALDPAGWRGTKVAI